MVAVRGDPSLLVEGLGDVVPGIVKWRKEVQETLLVLTVRDVVPGVEGEEYLG